MDIKGKQLLARWQRLEGGDGLSRAISMSRVLWFIGLALCLFVFVAVVYRLSPVLIAIAAAAAGGVSAFDPEPPKLVRDSHAWSRPELSVSDVLVVVGTLIHRVQRKAHQPFVAHTHKTDLCQAGRGDSFEHEYTRREKADDQRDHLLYHDILAT